MKAFAIALVAVLAITAGAQARELLQTSEPEGSANTVVRWLVPSNGVLDAVRVPIDGTVTFSWTSLHDLWEIPSAQCPETFENGTGITQIAPQSTGGSAEVVFEEETVRYFACSVADHCDEGQLIAIRVGDARAGAPAPGPSSSGGSSGGYSGNASPGYSGGSSSNYGSNAASGTNSTASSGYSGNQNTSPGYGGGASAQYGGGDSGR